MTPTVLNVPDISCDHCDRTITGALEPVAGMESVTVDIPARQVRLDYDPDRVNLDQIKDILEKEYYFVASVATAEETATKVNVLMAETLNTTAIDPVCGMSVDTQTAQFSSDYEGQIYYFCSSGCMRSYTQDPQRYLDANSDDSSTMSNCSCCR